MLLATRCPTCGTSFRVVQDQLKVSEGFVRCGRCNEVFNAVEALFDAEVAGPAAALTGATSAPVQSPPDGAPSDSFESTLVQESMAPPLDADDAAEPSEPASDTYSSARAAATFGEATTPTFLRQPRRTAARSEPRMRRSLAAAGAVSCVLLAAQVVGLYRDVIAAHVPAVGPLLESACAWMGCEVEPLRRIDALAVDASGLRQVEGTSLYRLSVVLHNRADTELMLPAFDLQLTDTLGRLVARRALTAQELGSLSRRLPAGGELALQASLSTGERPVSGYTIEIFYP